MIAGKHVDPGSIRYHRLYRAGCCGSDQLLRRPGGWHWCNLCPDRVRGYPVTSIFNPNDLGDYQSYDSRDCPWCKQGKRIDALVNSFIIPACNIKIYSLWWNCACNPPQAFVLP